MIRGTLAATVLAALMIVSGCGMQGGSTVVKYERGSNTARMTKAGADGMYKLYSSTDGTPKYTASLKKGDDIGFKMGDDGKLYAVAGDHQEVVETSMMSRTIYWKMADK